MLDIICDQVVIVLLLLLLFRNAGRRVFSLELAYVNPILARLGPETGKFISLWNGPS